MSDPWPMYVITALLGFALFAFCLRKRGLSPWNALLALPLSALLGAALAKGLYVLFLQLEDVAVWGEWDVFLTFQPKRLCFFGGAVGCVLGVFLAARWLRQDTGRVLDAFAAPGALLVAGFRAAEATLEKLGVGTLVLHDGLFSSPPFVLVDAYGDRYEAIFFWEALCALVICLLALFSREHRPGITFHRAAYRLCLCQILLESMRSQCMRWGFVRVEMVTAAVVILLLTIVDVLRFRRGWWPVAVTLLLLGGIVGAEFARQKASSPFLADYGYVLMALILVGMGLVYEAVLRPGSSTLQ